MTPSLWLDRPLARYDDPFPDDGSFDDVVVGAGLTGLVTAVLLARAGRRVGVLEARHVGAVTTGHTTAKASLLQATKLSAVLRSHSHGTAAAYVEANREGLAWLRRFCADHGVAVQERDAVTFAASEHEVSSVRREHDAARSLGLDVRWEDRLDVPFRHHGAVVLAGQAQLDPVELVLALVEHLRGHGGTVHEGHRVVTVSKAGRPRLRLSTGRTVTARSVVLATGVPVLDRGLTFAKVEPKRSYLLAYTGVEVPRAMFISAGSSSRSLRDVPGAGAFLVGGSGHTVGRTGSEERHLEELRGWTAQHFPGASQTHAWSAQDYSAYDGLPLIGSLPLGGGRIHYATGYDKWGMTNAPAAALYLAAQILHGTPPEWGRRLARRTPTPRDALHLSLLNGKVGAAMGVGWAGAELRGAPGEVEEGAGAVGRQDLLPTGVSTVDGRTCRVAAVCTHLGGRLKWNDAERSWDCPLHGSRFTPDGRVLEGPATRPLTRR